MCPLIDEEREAPKEESDLPKVIYVQRVVTLSTTA